MIEPTVYTTNATITESSRHDSYQSNPTIKQMCRPIKKIQPVVLCCI